MTSLRVIAILAIFASGLFAGAGDHWAYQPVENPSLPRFETFFATGRNLKENVQAFAHQELGKKLGSKWEKAHGRTEGHRIARVEIDEQMSSFHLSRNYPIISTGCDSAISGRRTTQTSPVTPPIPSQNHQSDRD